MSPVRFTGYHYPAGEERGSYWNVWGVANVAMPVIDIRQPKLVRNFLTSTWSRFRRLRRPRRLRSVFAQMWMPDQPEQPIEMRLLLAVVTVESLKTTYARSRGILFAKGRFRQPNNRPYSFEELVRMMFSDVGMRRGIQRLTKVRNEVIHTALVRGSLRMNERRFRRIHDLLREYLLRLLGYRGPWMSYVTLRGREID